MRARERERENERGRERERERKGKRRGGGGEFLRVSHPLGLLKCQLLSSWLAQFHSSRGRRKTRSSHDPPFLNTSRNYCRERESQPWLLRDPVGVFPHRRQSSRTDLPVRGVPRLLVTFFGKQRSARLCQPKQTERCCSRSSELNRHRRLDGNFDAVSRPGTVGCGTIVRLSHLILPNNIVRSPTNQGTAIATLQLDGKSTEFGCWSPKLFLSVRLFAVDSRWPVGCLWVVSWFTSLSAVAMATAHHWAASKASSAVAAEALEVTLSFPIGVWVVAGLLSLPAWTFRATCPSVTAFVIPKCDCPISWITTRWPKSSNRRPHGSHFSTSAAMPTPSSSSALSLGKASILIILSLWRCWCWLFFSLFCPSPNSPVCLDRPIYPCRGLCERVRQGCEGRMKTYGYPWPDMLRCDKFPLDNDMCIGPLSSGSSSEGIYA